MNSLTKKVSIILAIFIAVIILDIQKVSASYVIQVKSGQTTWTGISASDAYDKCEELNTSYSTLGTDQLNAHLTTNADWYAVTLLTYSSYGSKNASNTTGNNSGVKNFGTTWTFTASLLDGVDSNSKIASLKTNTKGYVETVYNNTNRANNKVGLGLRSEEIIVSSSVYYADSTSYPVTVRSGLFSFSLGGIFGDGYFASGAANQRVTFRPVIWN
jgi:hypothetical protein